MIDIYLGKDLRIKGVPFEHMKFLCNELTLSNPLYYKSLNAGRWVGKMPKEFRYYMQEKEFLIAPKGFIGTLTEYLKSHGLVFTINDERVCPASEWAVNFYGDLRDYQLPILEKISTKEIGLLHASTGFGKTVMACKIIADRKTNGLFITTRTGLIKTFLDSAENFLKIPKKEIGIIQGDKFDIKPVTVASIDTIAKRDLSEISKYFGVVIFDEVHQMITPIREQVLQSFYSKYHYGMTATPQREDGKTKAIYFLAGRTMAKYQAPMMVPDVYIQKTEFTYPYTDDYAAMITEMCEDRKRNELVIQTMKKFSGLQLWLSKRKEHCNVLAQMVGAEAVILNGDVSSKEQEEIKKKLVSGDHSWKYVIGTFALLATGTDIQQLEILGMVGDVRSEILSTQSTGRILRILHGKKPKIIDFCDEKQPILKYQFIKRKKLYQKSNFPILPISL